MKVKLAQFKAADRSEIVCYFAFPAGADFIRISEWVEVEFPPIAGANAPQPTTGESA